MSDIKVKLVSYDHHRNGISGTPFYVCIFDDITNKPPTRMVGVVFPEWPTVAVFDLAKLAAGDITFGSNSWRGDWYSDALREAIKAREELGKL